MANTAQRRADLESKFADFINDKKTKPSEAFEKKYSAKAIAEYTLRGNVEHELERLTALLDDIELRSLIHFISYKCCELRATTTKE